MKFKKIITNSLFLILFLFRLTSFAAEDHIEVGIDEKLGDNLPMQLEFFTSEGDTVSLKNLITKPVLFALVYYECPGICSPLLTELAWVINKVDLSPGEDFQVITLSFDDRETPVIAANWKRNYLNSIGDEFPADAWTFLTGDSLSIKKLTDAVGFYFKPVNEDYVHAGTVISISPEGKISRYLFGPTFNPFDIKMALLDAQSGKTNPTIAKVLQFCFSYDPAGRAYTLNITRIIGSLMLLSLGVFFTVLVLKKKKDNNMEGVHIDA